jgi:hypothetical protein
MSRLKRWMERYFPSFAATFAGLLVVALGGAVTRCNLPGLIGGVSRAELSGVIQQSPVMAFETVREGIRYKEQVTMPGTASGKGGSGKTIPKETELIPQGIYVSESCILLVTAHSKCTVLHDNTGGSASVITAITVDGIKAAEDCAYSENRKVKNLFSSTVALRQLQPGMHRLAAEGNFFGSTVNPDTTMQYLLIRNGDRPLLINAEKKKKQI